LTPYAKVWGPPELSEPQRLTANNYVGTARERALTPKSMGLTARHNNGEKETTKADAGYAES